MVGKRAIFACLQGGNAHKHKLFYLCHKYNSDFNYMMIQEIIHCSYKPGKSLGSFVVVVLTLQNNY